jgi:hypothetical protein
MRSNTKFVEKPTNYNRLTYYLYFFLQEFVYDTRFACKMYILGYGSEVRSMCGKRCDRSVESG